LHRPVDFAGRMAYNDAGEEVFNFGKHKGKKVEDVFNIEPSYYSWMMQGDFPLYTKRKLEDIYKRWNEKKKAERQQQPAQPKPTAPTQNTGEAKQTQQKPSYQQKPYQKTNNNQQQYKKKEEPARPVDDDMLKLLADKFKKG
jgi:DNA polymerase-3 subunit epsilon